MKRLLCVLARAALVMLPDWASACWRRGYPAYQRYYGYRYVRPVAYRAPVYYAAAPTYYQPVYQQPVYQQPVYQQPIYCQPVYVQPSPQSAPVTRQPLQPPRIVPQPSSTGAPSDPPAARPEPAPADPVRPASGAENPAPAKPEPTPEPRRGGLIEIPNLNGGEKPPAPPAPKLAEPKEVAPKADESKAPLKVPEPRIGGDGAKLPPLELPKTDAKAKLPPLELPKDDPKPKAEPGNATAVPVPAPAPDVLIPPPDVPAKTPDSLPPLTLPPDAPVAPREVEAKSSPLHALNVRVIAASGSKAADGLRKIGFYNHTKRDLALTIEGKKVTLPAMSYLPANLPPTFTWKCADRPAAKEAVPADAAGVDVVIRE
jgi:hypothetical protein